MQLLHYERAAWIDAVRLALQGATAAALTWTVLWAADWPHATWAVISALLVGQHSADGTLVAVRGRLAGTLLGAAAGLASTLLLPGDEWTLLRLVLAAAVVSAIVTLQPRLRYAAVVAAIIALEPGADPFEGALERTRAIGIGAAAGAACAFLVWPQSAWRRMLRALRRALDDCAELLDVSIRSVLGEDTALAPLHRRFLRHVRMAREQLAPMRSKAPRDGLDRTLHAVERLWHAIIVLDRITSSDEHWSPEPGTALHDQLRAIRTAACKHLRELAAAIGAEEVPCASGLDARLQEARALAQRAGTDTGVDASALGFALREIGSNLEEIRSAAATLR